MRPNNSNDLIVYIGLRPPSGDAPWWVGLSICREVASSDVERMRFATGGYISVCADVYV